MPFGEYSSFDDCVSQNQDKDDPEAFCAWLKRRIEGKAIATDTEGAANPTYDERIIEGWATVETEDSDGDEISVKGVYDSMKSFFAKETPILFLEHQSIPIGRILSYKLKKHEATGQLGLWVKAKIYKDYSVHDEVWDAIKKGEIRAFSIKGRPLQGEKKCDDTHCWNFYPAFEILELSAVSNPANKEALMERVNELAKATPCGEIIKAVMEGCLDKESVETEPELGDIEKAIADTILSMMEDGLIDKQNFPGRAGTGERFDACVRRMRNRKGVTDPEALCAYIGRRAGKIKSKAINAERDTNASSRGSTMTDKKTLVKDDEEEEMDEEAESAHEEEEMEEKQEEFVSLETFLDFKREIGEALAKLMPGTQDAAREAAEEGQEIAEEAAAEAPPEAEEEAPPMVEESADMAELVKAAVTEAIAPLAERVGKIESTVAKARPTPRAGKSPTKRDSPTNAGVDINALVDKMSRGEIDHKDFFKEFGITRR